MKAPRAQRKPNITNAERPEPRYRYYGRTSPESVEHTPIRAEVTAKQDGNTAVIRLYDVIDSWGGYWGISANEFVNTLDELEDVKTIQLRINSPGGDTFEGVTIYNALVDHPAQVDVVVDGIAASAASVIAMAGDTITVNTGAQMMIHDAWSICLGDASEMRDMANLLDKVSNNVASVYAERAGGTVEEWREAMVAESWYSAEEAVEAGLATAVGKKSSKDNKDDNKSKSAFDLSIFNHAGRANAPARRLDTRSGAIRASVRNSSPQGQETDRMPLNPEVLQSLGLPADASEDQLNSAIAELVKSKSESGDPAPTTTPDSDPAPSDPEKDDDKDEPQTPDPGTEGAQPQAAFQPPAGTVVVDEAAWSQVQTMLQEHQQDKVANALKDRDDTIRAAMKVGKFPPSQKSHYEGLWDDSPAKTKALINALPANSVPVQAIGNGDDTTDVDNEDDAYPEAWKNSLRLGKEA